VSIAQLFKDTGNVLQLAIPIGVGFQDTLPEIQSRNGSRCAQKAAMILSLIAIQRYGTKAIKRIVGKERPDKSNFESFPSGHFMIGALCLTRVIHRDGPLSPQAIACFMGTITLGLGRWLPGKHDVVDLTGGGMIGAVLGHAWTVGFDTYFNN
jgi:membrane-associated phospholipid phosphatase